MLQLQLVMGHVRASRQVGALQQGRVLSGLCHVMYGHGDSSIATHRVVLTVTSLNAECHAGTSIYWSTEQFISQADRAADEIRVQPPVLHVICMGIQLNHPDWASSLLQAVASSNTCTG